jgi:uncharacterized membrane protein HdeD (DUF308 family)
LLMAGSGLIEVLSGHRGQTEQHRGLLLGGGVLSVVIGLLVVGRPSAGLAAISLLLAGFLFAAAAPALMISALDRYPGWGWDFTFGAAAVVLGIATISSWPALALWLPGSLVGIAIVIRGATMVAGGLDPGMRPRAAHPA